MWWHVHGKSCLVMATPTSITHTHRLDGQQKSDDDESNHWLTLHAVNLKIKVPVHNNIISTYNYLVAMVHMEHVWCDVTIVNYNSISYHMYLFHDSSISYTCLLYYTNRYLQEILTSESNLTCDVMWSIAIYSVIISTAIKLWQPTE